MDFNKLTIPQRAAVTEKGSILVSAAAGSGKTAVLVNRILTALTREKDPLSADRILVVTFTNSAAAEMRARLEKEIEDFCRKNPNNKEAHRQKILMQTAAISTIDSYCISLVRENFNKAKIDIDFKIAEENELAAIKDTAAKNVFEKYYESENQLFIELLDAFGSMYDDKDLIDAVKEIYEEGQNMPFPSLWLCNIKARYSGNSFDVWEKEAFETVKEMLERILRYINAADKYFAENEELKKAYGPSFDYAKEKTVKALKEAEAKEWDSLFDAVKLLKFDSFLRSKIAADDSLGLRVKKLRSIAENIIEKVKGLVYAENETVKNHYNTTAPLTLLLIELVEEYSKELDILLHEKNTYTFNYIEHKAFELLCEYNGSDIVLREDAGELIDRYDEIFVDEYQDVNNLQDMFFHFMSAGGKKLFVVGDIKQSIYGFRGANPENFQKKQAESVDYKTAKENETKSIILDANFRSRSGVCGFVNHIFDRIMTEENCGINYKLTERLSPKADFPKIDIPAAEYHIIDCKDEKEKVAEAAHIADYILSVMNEGKVIKDKKTGELRRAKFSDFAVITRYLKPVANVLVEEFVKRGIPVSYTKEGFLKSKEIKTMLSLLSVVDNPTREVELLSTLMSPFFCFTPDDMANIRINSRRGGLYLAVVNSAKEGNEKCIGFLKTLSNLQKLAAIMPLSSFISHVYNLTDYKNIVSLMSDSMGRLANLNYLITLAEEFEAAGNKGIFAFRKSLENLGDEKLKGAVMSDGNDSVKLMTIHYSKGLQFPVCIVAYCGNNFSNRDSKKSLIIDNEFGISFMYYNDDEGKITPIDKKLLSFYQRKRQLKEELRMLYVAATRAEDRLVFTTARSNVDLLLFTSAVNLEAADNKVSKDIYVTANCYADWMTPCVLLHSDANKLRSMVGFNPEELSKEEGVKAEVYGFEDFTEEEKKLDFEVDCNAVESIKKRLDFIYPYDVLRNIEAKSSVSAIVHKAEEGDYDFTLRPGFLNENGLTATGRGTAVHKIMQYMDYDKIREDFDGEIERLKEWEYISEEEAKVDTKHIKAFVKSRLFERMCSSEKLKREMKFLTFLPAEKINGNVPENFKNEQIVVQGAVDCMFIEDGGVVIVDFKTDRVNDEKKLIDCYAEQLNIYAMACEKITGLPVKEKIIYSLVLDSSIVV